MSAGIFEGVNILELGSGAAAPVAARYFAEQGARIIRIESAKRPDFLRILSLTPDNPHGLDGAPMFILLNPNKESVAVNLSTPEGVAIVRRLIVEWADVVSENFSPGVMAKWGLDYEKLAVDKPDLIMVSGCLFGQSGPQRKYPGFGGQSSAIAGFNHVTGWPDREALGPFGTITDSLAPRYVALLVTAALLHRRRTGRGQFLDVSQIEVGVYSLSEMVVRYSATGEIFSRCGNHDERFAPHAIYPCSQDRFVAIAVFSDEAWQALAHAMEIDWATEFPTNADRLTHRETIDARISAWTGPRDAYEVMEMLQSAGVEAGVVQTEADLLEDPQLRHRGHFQTLAHGKLGPMPFEHSAVRLSDDPPRLDRPGPDLGADTVAVLTEILGLNPTGISRLADDEILV